MKTLPKSDDTEKAVLSVLFQYPDKIDEGIDAGLNADIFINPCNSKLFNVAIERHNKNMPIDLVSVVTDLAKDDAMFESGGASYVTEVVGFTPTSQYFVHHIESLKKILALRTAYALAENITNKVLDGAECEEVIELLNQPVSEVHELLQGRSNTQKPKELIDSFADRFKARMSGEKTAAIPCDMPSFDRIYGGIPKGCYTVITAFPSTGKTTLGIQILNGICKAGYKGKFFTLEMSSEQVTDRLLITESGVSGSVISDPSRHTPTKMDFKKMSRAAQSVKGYKMEVDDEPRLHIDKLCAMARKSHREEDLDVIIVDYAQKLRGVRSKGDSHERECADVSGKLQALAKELGCAVVLLSQLTQKNGSISTKGGEVYTEDADYWFQILREKGQENVEDIVTMKDRHSGTNGMMHQIQFNKEYQRFQ